MKWVYTFIAAVSATVTFHPENVEYSLSAKELDPASLGIDTVNQWSGYLDYQDKKHSFYWFFESRNDPANDPVILYLNGGPGCSSMDNLFFETGPASIGPDLKPVHNPYSWNNNASIIFLDQPVNVGFSYSEERVKTTDDAARDVYNFLDLFFTKFPNLTANAFHIAGESYAGHYIPRIAHEIVSVHKDDAKFNLSSIVIGNGLTDPLVQNQYFKPMACGEGGYPAILDPSKCRTMSVSNLVCKGLTSLCSKTKLTLACVSASTFCWKSLIQPAFDSAVNPYDIRGPCEDPESGLCWKTLGYVHSYLNQEFVQDALGTEVSSYNGCNTSVGSDFFLTGDNSRPFQQYVTELLDLSIPALIYAGDTDYICNWLGNMAWSDALIWKDHVSYEPLPLKPWYSLNGSVQFGEVKNHGPFTFLRVFEAGHTVPYYQPQATMEMINRWISGDLSLGYSS
ncbi:hypothetical protein KDRO_C00970 [Kluyveromyces lactis]|nr:hypothetical protein KDRO_C00970 [Kluyveromyces lactis]